MAATDGAPMLAQLEELFWAMTGETAETFKRGRMVEAQVVYVSNLPGSAVR